MNDTDIFLKHSELIMPIGFIDKVNAAIETNKSVEFIGNIDSGCPGTTEKLPELVDIRITKVNSDQNVMLKFSHLIFKFTNGHHKCKISPSGDFQHNLKKFERELCEETDTVKTEDVETATQTANVASIQKRPRGRPRKVHSSSTEKQNGLSMSKLKAGESELVGTVASAISNESSNNACLPNDEGAENTKRRYGLRGAKLNTAIMNAVRGVSADVHDKTIDEGNNMSTEGEGNSGLEGPNHLTEMSENEQDINVAGEDLTDSDYEDAKGSNANKRKRKQNVQSLQTEYDLIDGKFPKRERRKRVSKDCICKICNRSLIDFTGVYEHVKKMHSDDPASEEYLEELTELKKEQCTICSETFADRLKLGAHEDKNHNAKTPVECFRCKKPFKTISSLKTHVRTMHLEEGRKPGLCHLCPATFRSVATLQQHIDEIHFGNKHVECTVCKKKFYNRSQMRRHSRIHGLDESKRIFCDICDKSFLFKHNLQRHMSAVHTSQTEAFHCSYCGKGFGQKTGMISHVQMVHFNLFPFSCSLCKAIFARSAMLKDHMSSFHKQADFQVEKMPKNSIYNKTVEDLFYCSYCSIGFHNKTKLVVHMHTDHSEAFPYSCRTCKQGFLEKSYLIIHRLKAHGEWIQDDDDIIKRQSGNISKIMQFISTKTGMTSKVVPGSTGEEVEESTIEMRSDITQEHTEETVGDSAAPQSDDVSCEPMDGTQPASLIVEVESGTSTYRYLIETPDTLGDTGSVTVAQDIANLLLAAEQTIKEESLPDTSREGVQQISLVINDENVVVPYDPVETMATNVHHKDCEKAEVVVETVAVIPEESEAKCSTLPQKSDPSIVYCEMENGVVENVLTDGNLVHGDRETEAEGETEMIQIQLLDADGNMEVMNVAGGNVETHGVDILQMSAVHVVDSGPQGYVEGVDGQG